MQFAATECNRLGARRVVRMGLSWSDLFSVLERMWELDQKRIAYYLGYHPSTISRLKKGGEIEKFSIKSDELYRKLFDPENPSSPSHGNNEKNLLKELRDIITDLGLNDATSGLNTTDYKAFVMGLLKLVKKNEFKNKAPKSNKSDPTAEGNTTAPRQTGIIHKLDIPESAIEDIDSFSGQAKNIEDMPQDEPRPDQLTLPNPPKFVTPEVMEQAIKSPFGTLEVLKAQNEYFRHPLSPKRKK
jgi:hypothetical protein